MVEIQLNNFRAVQDIASKYPAAAEKHVNKAIAKIFVKILNGVTNNAPMGVTGHLRSNWESNIGGFQGTLRSKQTYGGSVEYGTRPHEVSPMNLKDWARRKGLNPFAVAESIKKKGTKANPFLKRTTTQLNGRLDDILKQAIDDIVKDVI
jgi:hypothetical protein